jgi:hypothetical protein
MARLMLLQNRRRRKRKRRRILIMHESTGWFDLGMIQYGIGSSLVLVVFVVVVFVVCILADTCTEYKFVSGWAGAESTCRGVSQSLTGLFVAFSCCSSRRRD